MTNAGAIPAWAAIRKPYKIKLFLGHLYKMLSDKQLHCISLSFTTMPIRQICRKVDISAATYYAWLNNNEEFITALKAKNKEICAQLDREIICVAKKCLKALEHKVDNGTESAIYKGLDYYFKLKKFTELDDLKDELEFLRNRNAGDDTSAAGEGDSAGADEGGPGTAAEDEGAN